MRIIGSTLFLVLFCCLSDLQASLTWRPGEGWVDETSGQGLSASSSHDQLDLAKKLEGNGDYEKALKAYRELIRRWPLSFCAPEAQFKIGFINEKKGEFWDAYKAYLKMIDKYPNGAFMDQSLEQSKPMIDQALERIFSIGNLYLAGEPQKIWKIPVGPSMDRALEVYNSVIKAAPYGMYAPQAQFHIGLAYEKQKKFADAVDAYNKILDKYPGNPIADSAQYQIGYAWMRASSQADYDQSAAEKAIEAFNDFIIRFPNSPKVVAAREHIDRLKSTENQGSFNIAKFYEKQRNYKAAFIYYNQVVEENPDSKNAQTSKLKIEELRPLVEKDTVHLEVKPSDTILPMDTPSSTLPTNTPAGSPSTNVTSTDSPPVAAQTANP